MRTALVRQMLMTESLPYYEFFAGGGMARLGLGPGWRCVFANDCCEKKAAAYRENFPPADEFRLADVAALTTNDLLDRPALAWASFPCQDLSLAGRRAGVRAKRSGTFWPFWELMRGLRREGRPAPLIVLENVVGALTSNGGADFGAIFAAIADEGYCVGPLILNAIDFVPQSRPRLFIVAVAESVEIPRGLVAESAKRMSGPMATAWRGLSDSMRQRWIHWRLPEAPAREMDLAAIVLDDALVDGWRTREQTRHLLSLMNERHRAKLRAAQAEGERRIGAVFRRMRVENGRRAQRAEVRFDGLAGCMRTPAGGSSRQILLVVNGKEIRSRLLAPIEAARLMGVPDCYKIPQRLNDALHLFGDGLCVPVVSWLEKKILRPLKPSL